MPSLQQNVSIVHEVRLLVQLKFKSFYSAIHPLDGPPDSTART